MIVIVCAAEVTLAVFVAVTETVITEDVVWAAGSVGAWKPTVP